MAASTSEKYLEAWRRLTRSEQRPRELGRRPFGPPEPDVPQASLHWDRRYAADEQTWGDGPSELARLTVARLRPYASPELWVLDVGGGYGRDTRYLADGARLPRARHRRLAGGDRGGAQGTRQRAPSLGQVGR